MGASAFQTGAEFELNGRTFVLLRKFDALNWQAEDTKTKRIHEFAALGLLENYENRQLTFVSSNPVRPRRADRKADASLFTPEQWAAAKVRRAYAVAALDVPSTRSALAPVIKSVWDKLRQPEKAPNEATVIRWKNKYLAAGKDISALIERSDKKGNGKSRYPKQVEEFVTTAIENRFLGPERASVQEALEQAIVLAQRENQLLPPSMQLPLPTRRLVKRMIDAIPAFDRYAARHGRTAAVKRFRSVQAHRTTAAPLERAEIDHTPLDLMVIDDETQLPLGRPYVTACIDDYSRCVLGLYISFEPPSHFTVSRCLKMAFMPKVGFLKQYPAITQTWNAHGVMRDLVVDNGQEFHSVSLDNACYSLGIEIHYSARKTPWFKGKIERFLGTLNRAIAHGKPGTTFSNIFDKEDYDPSKFAVVRYSVLKEIVYTWVADVYHQQVHRTLGAPPAVVWDRSISPEDILVPDDPFRLDVLLGNSEQRVLSHKGIELYGLQYNSPELTTLRRQLGDKLNVEIRVDTADLGQIAVIAPDKAQVFKVRCLQYEYANGLSEWQHRVCKRYAARDMDAYNPEAWLEAKQRIRELVENEFMFKKQSTRTKLARYKNMDAAPTPKKPAPIPEPLPAPPPVVTPPRPLTPADLAHDTPAPRTRRIAPLYRDRSPSDIAEERAQ